MKDLSNENVIQVKKNGIQYLQFRKLLKYENKLKHCFTLKPLDFRNKSKDCDDYKKICDAIGVNFENIVHPKQTHTNIVCNVDINNESKDFESVDGLITDKKGKVLSLYFADCMPLLFYDPVKNVIGNIHSGWRGTVKKIGKVAIEKMISDYGCNPENIIACIGPTIRSCHFQVEDDVKDIFMDSFNNEDLIVKKEVIDGINKYYIDSVKANVDMFKNCGLIDENIVDSGICTVCNCDLIHSYRSEKNNSGRNASIMCLI